MNKTQLIDTFQNKIKNLDNIKGTKEIPSKAAFSSSPRGSTISL